MTKEEAIEKAILLMKTAIPDESGDDWFTISEDWDLNVWQDDDEITWHYTLYRVVFGETQVTEDDDFINIDEYFR
jgi:hypothetical protein